MNEINWLEALAKRPGMYLARDSHVLHRIQAFAEGLKWAGYFEKNHFETLPRILARLPEYIGQELTPGSNGIGWFDTLLAQSNGDEDKAFQNLIAHLIKVVEAEDGDAAPV